MMDYDDMMDTLHTAFVTWCDDNEEEYDDSKEDEFLSIARDRMEEIMVGTDSLQDAYEIYSEEINDDIAFVMRA